MDSLLNRISSISDTTGTPVTLASYTYLGLNTVIQITYPQPTNHVRLDLWGGTDGVFTGFDNFNRIIDQRWQNNVTTTPADIDRYQYGYDLDSNRTWKANPLTSGMDELYAYDALNRLTSMQRGNLTPGKTAISGTPAQEQDWTLDITGNWKEFKTKAAGSITLDQARTANKVNEITTNTYWAATEYDAAGNTTNFPQPASLSSAYTGVYDAWNRLVSVSNGGTPVGQYQYDGANRRIVKTSSPGGTSETRHFYYTANNQDIEERVGTATTMDKQFVWGTRYIDELVCRDSAASPTRLYATQDANFNVTALLDASTGAVDQRFQYDPYGTATVLTSTWTGTTDAYKWTRMFTGQFLDPETLIYYYRARYYHPNLGVFLGRDPITYRGGLNLYEYVGGNPIARYDPAGLQMPKKSSTGIWFWDWETETGAVDVPIFNREESGYGWGTEKLLIEFTWSPPHSWLKNPCCQQCTHVLWTQDISKNGGPWFTEVTAKEASTYGTEWDCTNPGNDAKYYDEPGESGGLKFGFDYQLKAHATCVQGPDNGKVYAEVYYRVGYAPLYGMWTSGPEVS